MKGKENLTYEFVIEAKNIHDAFLKKSGAYAFYFYDEKKIKIYLPAIYQDFKEDGEERIIRQVIEVINHETLHHAIQNALSKEELLGLNIELEEWLVYLLSIYGIASREELDRRYIEIMGFLLNRHFYYKERGFSLASRDYLKSGRFFYKLIDILNPEGKKEIE